MIRFLKFKNRKLEDAFISDYNERTLSSLRLGFLLATLLYACFGILDIIMMPRSYHIIWIIRFGIVIPLTLTILLLTYLRSLRKYLQVMISFNAIIIGLGIVAMIAIADESEPGFKFYYAGLMLVIMGICSLFRLRFIYVLFSSFVIILGYELTAVFIQKISYNTALNSDYIIFISNNFFFISANVIGLMAAYYLEYFMRVRFIQHEEIIEKHQDLSSLMNSMKMELELARQIQSNLFPAFCPFMKDMKIYSIYKPMEELGGDFYDYIRFEETNLIGIFISDVSGHGIPAALITSMVKTLSITSGYNKFSPPDFLKYINSNITGHIGDNFLTAVYIMYDTESRVMKLSRAGHPYPILIRKEKISCIESSGGMIGILHDQNFEEYSITLERGDKIILYTDGLTEETNLSNIMFENTYFNDVLPSINSRSIEEIVNLSYKKLIDYKGNERLSDDICIVGIEIL